jgi:hypothetical protein
LRADCRFRCGFGFPIGVIQLVTWFPGHF